MTGVEKRGKIQPVRKIVLVVYHETGCFAICSLECWCNPGGTFTAVWIRESNYCWIQTRGQGKLSVFTEAGAGDSQIRVMFRHVFMVKSASLLVCDGFCICVVQIYFRSCVSELVCEPSDWKHVPYYYLFWDWLCSKTTISDAKSIDFGSTKQQKLYLLYIL